MTEQEYRIGEGPATRISLSLSEGTAEAIRQRVGKREFSSFVASAVERELRGLILDEYLADYEQRSGALPASERQRAEEAFDRALAEPGQWSTAS